MVSRFTAEYPKAYGKQGLNDVRSYAYLVTLSHQPRKMLGTLFAGCGAMKMAMWTVTTVLMTLSIAVRALQLKRD
jgi:hypothetical protein